MVQRVAERHDECAVRPGFCRQVHRVLGPRQQSTSRHHVHPFPQLKTNTAVSACHFKDETNINTKTKTRISTLSLCRSTSLVVSFLFHHADLEMLMSGGN